MKTALWIIALVVALAVVLVGCSSGGSTSPAPAASQKASSSPSSSAAPSASAKPSEAAKPAPTTPEGILAELAKLPAAERQQKLVEGAKKEGKLVAYVSGDIEAWEAFKRDFQKKYPGLTFDFLRGGGDEMLERILAEHRAGKLAPDVIYNSRLNVLEDNGIVIPYTSPAKEAMAPKFRTATAADIDVNPCVIAWNTNLVKPADAPKRWEDLLDPKWKGRKMALDMEPTVMLYALYSKWGVDKGRDFVKKLLDQDLIPSRSHTTGVDQLAAGEFPVLVEAYAYRVVEMARGKGAPLGWTATDPMSSTGGGVMITKTTTRPHTAALLYDYLMSADAGSIYATFGRIPVQPGATMKYPEDERPLLEAPGLVDSGPDVLRKLYDTVMGDLKDIIQAKLAQ